MMEKMGIKGTRPEGDEEGKEQLDNEVEERKRLWERRSISEDNMVSNERVREEMLRRLEWE